MIGSNEQSGRMSQGDDDAFQRLADGAPVMIWMSGLDMGCFYFNRAWLDFRGRTLEEEAGNGWVEGVHPEELKRCVNHYLLCFERRVAFAMTYRLLNREGEYRWILDRGAPHFSAQGTFLGYVGGCAELDEQGPAARNAQLRTSLAEVRAWALRIAEEGRLHSGEVRVDVGSNLRSLGRAAESAEIEGRKRMNHAKAQLERLASDMVHHGHLQPGACVP
jgi:PAS domain S-box-containing protein